jgi:hypothetical protein
LETALRNANIPIPNPSTIDFPWLITERAH